MSNNNIDKAQSPIEDEFQSPMLQSPQAAESAPFIIQPSPPPYSQVEPSKESRLQDYSALFGSILGDSNDVATEASRHTLDEPIWDTFVNTFVIFYCHCYHCRKETTMGLWPS